MPISYLNTDLDLVSEVPIDSLISTLETKNLVAIGNDKDNGKWYTTFELNSEDNEPDPESTIVQMLDSLESIPSDICTTWNKCKREFNIGYDCGEEPWAFNQVLTNKTLSRISNLGASLRITLYPPHKQNNKE